METRLFATPLSPIPHGHNGSRRPPERSKTRAPIPPEQGGAALLSRLGQTPSTPVLCRNSPGCLFTPLLASSPLPPRKPPPSPICATQSTRCCSAAPATPRSAASARPATSASTSSGPRGVSTPAAPTAAPPTGPSGGGTGPAAGARGPRRGVRKSPCWAGATTMAGLVSSPSPPRPFWRKKGGEAAWGRCCASSPGAVVRGRERGDGRDGETRASLGYRGRHEHGQDSG